jgi:hypothetical protein
MQLSSRIAGFHFSVPIGPAPGDSFNVGASHVEQGLWAIVDFYTISYIIFKHVF